MLHVREYRVIDGSASEHAHPPVGVLPMSETLPDVLLLMAPAVALGSLLFAFPAQAIELGQGEVQGSLDTTISHGVTWRVGARDEGRVGDFRSANSNEGNLNYDRGIVSNTSKFTTDLDLSYRNFGAFVRATGFLDFENENGMRDRTPLSDDAKDLVGKELDLLDAYVTGAFDVGDAAVDLRVGRHVLNWGESTFITNGINAFNRFDVSKLRLPGSELREALVPIPMVSLSVAPTYNLSMEGFYQLDWEETVIDPVGSYFSTIDYVGPGAREAVITHPIFDNDRIGSHADLGFSYEQLAPGLTRAVNADLANYQVRHPQFGLIPLQQEEPEPDFLTVLRGPDRNPDDSGQWGLALRYLAEDLNDTEFGLYVANYHSRLPVVAARTSPREGIEAGLAAASAVFTPGAVVAPTSATIAALTQAIRAQVMPGVPAGLIDPVAAQSIVEEQVSSQLFGIATSLAFDRYVETPDQYGNTGHFFHEYPENVQLLGLSFNTALGASGWALQGDYALHLDAPLQRAERKLLREGLKPMEDGLGLVLEAQGLAAAAQEFAAAAEAAAAIDPHAAALAAAAAQEFAALARQASYRLYGEDGYLESHTPRDVPGYVRRDVSQIQATATKVFGPVLGADALAFVTEAAVMHVHSMPNRRLNPLESPARSSVVGDDANGDDEPDGDGDAHATSWGYRMAARLDYNNAIGAVNLFPYVQWRHDVHGNSPAPSGSFSEGLTALTLGLRADYLNSWRANVGYTRYGGRRNTLRDRDFISAFINYSF